MKTIVLLTDFGHCDGFVGVMKGVISGINPDVRVIDIAHELPSYDVRVAAFLLFRSFEYFPPGTIFIAVVDPGVGSKRRVIALKTKKYYFVGPDNGILSLAAQKNGIQKAVVLENKKYFLNNISLTFQGRDIFAPVGAHISRIGLSKSFGNSTSRIKALTLPVPKIKKGFLEGQIIYIDKFGNLTTNIENNYLSELSNEKVVLSLKRKKVENIYCCYRDAKPSQPFLIKGSFGYVEISLRNRSAKDYFSIGRFLKREKFILKSKGH